MDLGRFVPPTHNNVIITLFSKTICGLWAY